MLKTKARASKGDSRKTARRASRTRRTTLTLPEELLNKVERFAETRHQTVSAAIAYLVESALWNEPASPRNSRGILEMWRKSFLPLTEQERLLVDGIVLDEPITEAE